MQIEIGAVEAIAGLLIPIATAVAMAIRSAVKQLNQGAEDLRERVSDLEAKLEQREARIGKLETDLGTALEQLRDLQQWKALAQAEIEDKDKKIKSLTSERDTCKFQAEQAFESAKQWKTKHDTLADVLRTAVTASNAKETTEEAAKSATVADLPQESEDEKPAKEAEK